MAALISLDQAKTQLRVPWSSTEYDEDLVLKTNQATAIVLDYLADYVAEIGSPAWDIDTDPTTDPAFAIAQTAILEVLTNLVRFRGDDEKPGEGPLTPRVENMLRGLKRPVIG